MKKLANKFQNISKKLDELGLTLNHKSGGFFVPTNTLSVKKEGWDQKITIQLNNEKTVKLLPYDAFLSSLRETEKSFSLKLFVDN